MRISDWSSDVCSSDLDSGHIQVQRQMPLATQGAGDDYDVLVAIDENEIFGEYLPFNTYAPRPVVGTHGLVPMAWHRVQEQWGSTQIQHRFIEVAGRWMEERDYGAWLGVRAIGEEVTRTSSADLTKLRDSLRSEQHTSELQYLMRNSYAVFC